MNFFWGLGVLLTNCSLMVDDPNQDWLKKTGTLGGPYIRRRINLPVDHLSHIAVIPLDLEAIQAASLDVRLGNWFVTARQTRLRSIHLDKESDERLLKTIGKEEFFIPTGKSFLIHPGHLVLGCTLEFIALPADIAVSAEGRSGPGRKGLTVATATQIAPGFHGVVVLELANTGTVPLELEPGMSVGQLIFQTLAEPIPPDQVYHGKYHCQIKP